MSRKLGTLSVGNTHERYFAFDFGNSADDVVRPVISNRDMNAIEAAFGYLTCIDMSHINLKVNRIS